MSVETTLMTKVDVSKVFKAINSIGYSIIDNSIEFDNDGLMHGFVRINKIDGTTDGIRRMYVYRTLSKEKYTSDINNKSFYTIPHKTLMLTLGYDKEAIDILSNIGKKLGGWFRDNDIDNHWIEV